VFAQGEGFFMFKQFCAYGDVILDADPTASFYILARFSVFVDAEVCAI